MLAGHLDINEDGRVTPLDALEIINEVPLDTPDIRMDASGDGQVSVADAQLVIDHLQGGPSPLARLAAFSDEDFQFEVDQRVRQYDVAELTFNTFEGIDWNGVDALLIDWGDGRVDEVTEISDDGPVGSPTHLHAYFTPPAIRQIRILTRMDDGSEFELGSQPIEVVASSPIAIDRIDQGFTAAIYDSFDLVGDPIAMRTDPTVSFDFGVGTPDPRLNLREDAFGVRWLGDWTPPHTAQYTFDVRVGVNDSATLTIDGVSVVSTTDGPVTATIELERGVTVPVEIEYSGGPGQSMIDVQVESDTTFKTAFVSDHIEPTGNTADGVQGLLLESFEAADLIDLNDLRNSDSFVDNIPSASTFVPGFDQTEPDVGVRATRTRGWLNPPTSGRYAFELQSSGHAELWLSQSNQSGLSERLVETIDSTARSSQAVYLKSGQSHPIELLHVHADDTMASNVTVRWRRIDEPTEVMRPVEADRLRPLLPIVELHADVSQTVESDLADHPLRFRITRNDDLGRDLEVAYTIGGDAEPGTDYESPSGTIVIPKGQRSVSLDIDAVRDGMDEPNEAVTVRLVSDNRYQLGSEFDREVTATIIGNVTSGDELLPPDSVRLDQFTFYAAASPNTAENITVTDPDLPFGQPGSTDNVVRVEVNEFVNPWDVAFSHAIANEAITQSDPLFASVWARSRNADGSDATVAMRLQETTGYSGDERVWTVGPQWTRLMWPLTADFPGNHPDANRSLDVRLGYQQQVVEFAGMSLLSLPADFDPAEIPRELYDFEGRHFDAPWRSQAEVDLLTHRTRSLQIEVIDAAGNPVEGATVTVTPKENPLPIGMQVSPHRVVPAGGPSSQTADSIRYREILASTFNTLTDGGEAQWGPWEEDSVVPTQFLDWVVDQDLAYHGHSVVWGRMEDFPAPANLQSDYQSVLASDGVDAARMWLESEIIDHVTTGPAQAFSGVRSDQTTPKVDWWDVINHPIFSRDMWDIVGDTFMIDVINATRSIVHDDTKLIINEAGVLSRPNDGLSDDFFALLNNLDQYDASGRADYDTIGFQGHFSSERLPSIDRIIDELNRYDVFDRRYQITEYDLDTVSIDEQTQADFTRDFYLALASDPDVELFTPWGFWANEHWRSDEFAEWFDSDWTPRPSGQWLLDQIPEQSVALTDRNGSTRMTTTGMSTYDIEVERPDGTTITLKSDSSNVTVQFADVVSAVDFATFGGDNLARSTERRAIRADDLIQVDTAEDYVLSGHVRSGRDDGSFYDPDNRQYFGFVSYDSDQQEIRPWHVRKHPGAADTYLSQPLKPGDTIIHLEDASGWHNGINWRARHLALYRYTDGSGYTHPDFTYTRNVEFERGRGNWDVGAIDIENNTITLREPWVGDEFPAGSAIRNTTSGSAYQYAGLLYAAVANEWTEVTAVVSGVGNQSNQFRPGTAYIQPVVLTNYHTPGATPNEISWRNIHISKAHRNVLSAGQSRFLAFEILGEPRWHDSTTWTSPDNVDVPIYSNDSEPSKITFPASRSEYSATFQYRNTRNGIEQVGQLTFNVQPGEFGELAFLRDASTFGGASSLVEISRAAFRTDRYIKVDTTAAYRISGWARSGNDDGTFYDAENRQYFGFASYDIDRNPIYPWQVRKHTGAADTRLSQTLEPGDTTVHLDDVSGWYDGNRWWTRLIAFYDYSNADGFVYPDYSYTRNVPFDRGLGSWDSGSIDFEQNIIHLREPWQGNPIPSGTAVRNATSGPAHRYAALSYEPIGNEWTHYQATVSGIGDAPTQFRPGTAFIRPIVLTNYHMPGGDLNQIQWRDIRVTDEANYRYMAGESITVVVDLQDDLFDPTPTLLWTQTEGPPVSLELSGDGRSALATFPSVDQPEPITIEVQVSDSFGEPVTLSKRWWIHPSDVIS